MLGVLMAATTVVGCISLFQLLDHIFRTAQSSREDHIRLPRPVSCAKLPELETYDLVIPRHHAHLIQLVIDQSIHVIKLSVEQALNVLSGGDQHIMPFI